VCEALRLHVLVWVTGKEIVPSSELDDQIQVTIIDLKTLKGLFQPDEYSAAIEENAEQLRSMGIEF
jgi:hypothetical protein